jgi:hypothetical protein
MRWLEGRHLGVLKTGGRDGLGGRAIDLTFTEGAVQHRVKVKADPYFGTDPASINDHSLLFYRANQDSFAFEAVANSATKEPGWMFDSGATDLYYYFVAITQPPEDVEALCDEPDDVFFSELQVERDELVIFPMNAVREWFEANYERYPSRPVRTGGVSAWYRLVPRSDLQGAVPGLVSRGPIFPR